REGLRGERPGGHETGPEQRAAAGHVHGVDETVPQVDLGLLTGGVRDVEAAGRLLGPEVEQDLLERAGEEVAVEHASPPLAAPVDNVPSAPTAEVLSRSRTRLSGWPWPSSRALRLRH